MRALAKWAGLTVVEVDCIWGSSGFHDGSDQWGDCSCVLTKSTGELAAGENPHSGRRRPPDAIRHSSNPLDQAKGQPYYQVERRDVIDAIQRQGIQAKRILEIGCAAGATGRLLGEMLNADRYVGIEAQEEVANAARCHLSEVHVADVEKVSLTALGLRPNDFDLVVALDVLEHLYDPWTVLTECVYHLRPGGTVVLSIPNIQNIAVIGNLIAGRWTYESMGLLDATHVRFFTLAEIHSLVAGAGLRLLDATSVLNPKPNMSAVQPDGNRIRNDRLTISDLTRDELVQLTTYQYIITAQKPHQDAPSPEHDGDRPS